MGGRQSLPREGIDEQGMLLEILLQRILLRENTSTIGVAGIVVVVAFLYAVAIVVAVDVVVDAVDVGASVDVGLQVLLKHHESSAIICVIVLAVVLPADIEIIVIDAIVIRDRLDQIGRFSVLSVFHVVQLLV